MDDYEKMYKTICRLCLSQNSIDKMVNLIDNSNGEGLSCFGKAIATVTNVLLQKNDKLPTMMCQKCVFLLKQTIYFKLKCESTDKQLKQLVNDHTNSETSDRNIKQIVCEYAMFRQYFPAECNSKPKIINKLKNLEKKSNFIQQNDQKPAVEKVEIEIELTDKTYDFEDFIESEDISNNFNEKPEEHSNKINNILDTIHEMVNTNIHITPKQRKIKKVRKERKYRPIPESQRNITCKICHRTLANRFTFANHMQRHNICRYICDQCGKGFPVLTSMHMHQIARHGIGPYLQCDHCPYKAPRKLSLIEHLRIHTGERPFTCEKCGLTFRRRAIWRNHLVVHMEKQLQCSYCPRKFYRRGSLLAHCNNVHERMYMYMCSICSVTYAKTETVKRHMLAKHGIPREKQGKIMRIMKTNSEFPHKV